MAISGPCPRYGIACEVGQQGRGRVRSAPDHDRRGVPEATPDLAGDAIRVEVVAEGRSITHDHSAVGLQVHGRVCDDSSFTQAHHTHASALGGRGGDRGRPEVHTEAVDHRVAFLGPT